MDALTKPNEEAWGIFGYSHGSAYDETTATFSNRRTSAVSRGQGNTGSDPPRVIVCQVIEEV